jgi:protocatechuate 3,4-dioxygenase alpha subunit
MPMLAQTPSQTVGPFFHEGLVRTGENVIAGAPARGQRIIVTGQIVDGDGKPAPDALVEIWHADAAGVYPHPGDPRHAEVDPAFRGLGRSDTQHDGDRFRFETIKPGRVAGPHGVSQAPHACVRIFARGLLTHLTTRMYFADEAAANDTDPVLARVDAARRSTLLAERIPTNETVLTYRWNIVLQGRGETVFFEP